MKKIKNLFILNLFLISAIFAQENYSLSFDGVNDFVESQTLDLTSSPFTIEAWIKMPTVSFLNSTNIIDNYETSPSTDKRWGVYVGGTDQTWTGKIYFREVYSTVRIDDNNWHHIAVVRDASGTVNLFLDGNLNSSGSLPINTDLNAGHTIKIGSGHNFFGQRFMECIISELQVSLAAIYTSNFSPTSNFATNSSAVLHYNFNQGNGSILIDQSQTGNDGTINGASWSSDYANNGCTNIYASNYNENANYNVGCEFEQNSNSILYTVNPEGNTLTDYELLFDVPAQDEMSSDYSDVLFVDSFNNVLSSYVSEYDENSAKIWVKLDTLFSGSSNSILCFYGESSFSNPNDPFQVFTLYENFNNGSFYNTWTVNQSKWSFAI